MTTFYPSLPLRIRATRKTYLHDGDLSFFFSFQIKDEISRLNIFVMKYKRLCALGSFRLTVLNVILCHKALSSIRKFRFYSQHFNSNLAIPKKSEKKCLELFFSFSCGHNPLSFHNLQLQGAGVIFWGVWTRYRCMVSDLPHWWFPQSCHSICQTSPLIHSGRPSPASGCTWSPASGRVELASQHSSPPTLSLCSWCTVLPEDTHHIVNI